MDLDPAWPERAEASGHGGESSGSSEVQSGCGCSKLSHLTVITAQALVGHAEQLFKEPEGTPSPPPLCLCVLLPGGPVASSSSEETCRAGGIYTILKTTDSPVSTCFHLYFR